MNRIRLLLATAVFALLAACSDAFSYHPYDVRFGGEDNINRRNMERIEAACRNKDTIRLAVISDTHGWYGETKLLVADVNRRGVDFVIHGGDLTDCATMTEYEWAREVLGGLKAPYVALIGNHDMLGSGEEIFRRMYGEVDFSFIAGGVKFLCLNTNATEYNYMAPVPNFDFMLEESVADTALFDRTVLVMHSRPFCDQFNNNVARIFSRYYRELFPGMMFCLSGHGHNLAITDVYDDGIPYYESTCAEDLSYFLFTITPVGYEYEIVNL